MNLSHDTADIKETSMKTNQYLIDFYNHYDEDSRLSPRHGTVEFLTTMRYIEKYISPGNRVLEIGAATVCLKSARQPAGIPMGWHDRGILLTQWSWLRTT